MSKRRKCFLWTAWRVTPRASATCDQDQPARIALSTSASSSSSAIARRAEAAASPSAGPSSGDGVVGMQATVVAYRANVNLGCLSILEVRGRIAARARMILPMISGGMVAVGLALFSSLIAVAVVIGVTLSKRRR